MPLSSRTQPRPSSPCSGAAFVTSVPQQTGPHGHRASTRPGQVQTTHLAPRSRNSEAGRMPTALVTTIISTLLRGPGSRHPCWEFRTQQKAISLPYWEPGVGILEASDRRSRCQQLAKETSRAGRTRANKWIGELRDGARWSQICYHYDAILKGRTKGLYPQGSEDIVVDIIQQKQCVAPLRTE